MTMLDYIMEQPVMFQDMMKQNVEITAGFGEIFREEMPDTVYLIASGTSCNAAKAAAPFMVEVLHRRVSVLPPSQLEHVYGENPLIILISQGGKSTNMIAAAERMKEYCTVAMCGSRDGKIQSICKHDIMIPCGDENVGPKTKGYTATVLMLYLMALRGARVTGILTEDAWEEYIKTLDITAAQYAENIRRSKQWMEDNEDGLKALKEIYLVGKGQSLSIAGEGALKMMETYLIPGTSFDFEEYLHGPSCSLRESMGGMYLLPVEQDGDYERMQKLAGYHRGISEQVYTVGLPSSEDKRDCCLLSSGQWYTRPFEAMLPLQLICAVIPERLGIDGVGMEHFKAIDLVMGVKYKE